MDDFEYEFQIGSPLPAIGCLTLVLMTFFMCLMPVALVDMMHTALSRLHLSPPVAMLALMGIFLGSLINIPVYRIERPDPQPQILYGPVMFGLFSPRFRVVRSETVVAVNVGGCVIPSLLAVWELLHVRADGGAAWVALVMASSVNIAVCYFAARPVAGIGIMMPGFLSPLVSVSMTWMLLSTDDPHRAPVAFVAGVLGPLVGADILHLKDVGRLMTGMLSIGGAGTFDGIVLSGLVAAFLS